MGRDRCAYGDRFVSDRDQERRIGAIAFYRAATYCVETVLRGKKFFGPIKAEKFDTTTPDGAFSAAVSFFKRKSEEKLDGLGVSLYGVVETQGPGGSGPRFLGGNEESWTDEFDIYEKFASQDGSCVINKDRLYCHTDAAAAAIAEYLWGAGADLGRDTDFERRNLAYFKIQEGIGSGIILAGRLWDGSLHPEMGHLPIRRRQGDDYSGGCLAHRDCAEGLASFSAMTSRLRRHGILSLDMLHDDDDAWDLESYYLAELAAAAYLVVAPERIIFEGEFIRNHLLTKIRREFRSIINKYPEYSSSRSIPDIDRFIVAPKFPGPHASLLGALELARREIVNPATDIPQSKLRLADESIKKSEFHRSLEGMIKEKKASHTPTGITRRTAPHLAPRTDGLTKVFGLSITEEIEWAVSYAVENRLREDLFDTGIFSDIPNGNLPHSRNKFINIESMIRARLIDLRKKRFDLFKDVTGIGVSTIGVVDRSNLRLDSIARKNWSKKDSADIIDFENLFLEPLENDDFLFPGVTDKSRIVVQNDASARCVTEYFLEVGQKIKSGLLYIMVGEGVNGAIAYGGDLPHMLRHSELGHCRPQLHPTDARFDNQHSGCPSHGICFEGLASIARFRMEGVDLLSLPEHDPAWDVEAYYVAQLILIGVTMLNPEKVLLGGSVFSCPQGRSLLDKVRSRFWTLNARYLPDYKDRNAVNGLIERAKYGNGIKILSALTMGRLAAFPKNLHTSIGGNVLPFVLKSP